MVGTVPQSNTTIAVIQQTTVPTQPSQAPSTNGVHSLVQAPPTMVVNNESTGLETGVSSTNNVSKPQHTTYASVAASTVQTSSSNVVDPAHSSQLEVSFGFFKPLPGFHNFFLLARFG